MSRARLFTAEKDLMYIPKTANALPWHTFNCDVWCNPRKYEEVHEICQTHSERLIDLRPYMIEEPHVVFKTDKLTKCLELFRHLHLRALPVIDPGDGTPVAVLTRQDIFQYMAL